MVWRLDRPGRALKDLIARAEALRIQGVGLKSLKEAIDTDSVCSGAAFVRTQQVFGYLSIQPATYVACTAAYYVDAYLAAAGIAEDRRGPLFRSCQPGRRDALQDRAMSRLSALKMIKRRARKAGLTAEICAHSFRGTGITEYLRNGGDLEIAARIAGHVSIRTTQLYNRLPEEISLDEIERIHI